MKPKAKQSLIAALVLAACAAAAPAEIVRIGLTAEISYVDPYSQWLNDNFKLGDIITGSYTYDTDTPDTNPSPTVGDYRYYSAPFGVSLNCNGFTFETDPENVDFRMVLSNDWPEDQMCFINARNAPISGPDIFSIWWQLDDWSGTSLSSTALPTAPPLLDAWDYQSLGITFGSRGSAALDATVTSAVLIPEPATLLLLVLGAVPVFAYRKARTRHGAHAQFPGASSA